MSVQRRACRDERAETSVQKPRNRNGLLLRGQYGASPETQNQGAKAENNALTVLEFKAFCVCSHACVRSHRCGCLSWKDTHTPATPSESGTTSGCQHSEARSL